MEAFLSANPQTGKSGKKEALSPLPRPGRRLRVRYSNKTKVLLCYALAFGLALALPLGGLLWVYPYTLVGTAPALAENLLEVLPALEGWLGRAAETASVHGLRGEALGAALDARDLHWRLFLGSGFLLTWLLSLALQLLWRRGYRRPLMAARAALRAVRTFRLTLLVILALNALGGVLVYFLGIRFITHRTFWDWLLCEGGFALNLAAGWICFRLAAPPAISGKHGFFRRL